MVQKVFLRQKLHKVFIKENSILTIETPRKFVKLMFNINEAFV